MGSPMLITSEYVTSSPPSPPPGGVDTFYRDGEKKNVNSKL